MAKAAYAATRAATLALTEGLSAEDMAAQAMPDASPAKWHLAHTTWFFEVFVLEAARPGRRPFDPAFRSLFNSYYEAVGPRPPRPERGLLTRPPLEEVLRYRRAVDEEMAGMPPSPVIDLGLAHEEQHQELMITDLLALFALSPLEPGWRPPEPAAAPETLNWVERPAGRTWVGHGGAGFAFDNESPRHEVLLRPHRLATRPVTAGEYLEFIAEDGYRRPELWMADGWDAVRRMGWQAPGYWRSGEGGGWSTMTPAGRTAVDPHAAVRHVSWYEADAFARWAGARLPTEAEWEAATALPGTGQVWEWTASAYLPHPGYRAADGALGEYNGKFMVGQMVLKGGSVASPAGHVRPSTRNFFPPAARWQFTGLRLAADS